MNKKTNQQQVKHDRVIRVFVSSTFRDMQAEREELVKRVFPQLRKLCESRGVVWGEVDLRWGIPDEQKAEGQVLPICLREIHNCRPYFIGLLGERYGWVPEKIPRVLKEAEPWLAEHQDRSVTELEILHGVLNNPEMAGHALFYFRDPHYVETQSHETQAFLREVPLPEEITQLGEDEANRLAAQRAQKLADLKARIRSSSFPVRENFPDPQSVGQLVLQDFTELINRLYPEESVPNPLVRDAALHEGFAQSRARVYIGRQKNFDRLNTHVQSDGLPLVVLGESGMGKSALLANWALQYRKEHPNDVVLFHFIGASADSADWAAMLRRIMGELNQRFDLMQEIPDQPDALRLAFANFLHMAGAKGKVILILDALNQLEDHDGAPDLVWLPPEIPSNVRLVLSTLPGRPLDDLTKRGWPTMTVSALEPVERTQLIANYLAQYTKTLSASQMKRVVSASQTTNPLFLRTLLEELRVFGEYEHIHERINYYLTAQTVSELFEKILERYEQDYERERPGLVREALSCLWAARRGLTENELLELLGKEEEPLPQAHWSPLHLAMEQGVTNKAGLLGFSHNYLRQAVQARYVLTEEDQKAAHLHLANYFHYQETNVRKIEELPHHLACAKDWTHLNEVLSSLSFVKQAWGLIAFDLQSYWVELERHSGFRMNNAFREVISHPEKFEDFAWSVGSLLVGTGYFDEALTLLERQSDLYRETGKVVDLLKTIESLASIHQAKGSLVLAMALYQEQEMLAKAVGRRNLLKTAVGKQAQILFVRGDQERALKLLTVQQEILQEEHDLNAYQSLLGIKALILHSSSVSECKQVLQLLREQVRICRELGHMSALQWSLGLQGLVAQEQGDLQLAVKLLDEQERICRQIGDRGALQEALKNQALIQKKVGNSMRAMNLLQEQEELCRDLEIHSALRECLRSQSEITAAEGDLTTAQAKAQETEQVAIASGDNVDALLSRQWLAEMHLRQGNTEGASEVLGYTGTLLRISLARQGGAVFAASRYRQNMATKWFKNYRLVPFKSLPHLDSYVVGKNCFICREIMAQLPEIATRYDIYGLLYDDCLLWTMTRWGNSFVCTLPINGGACNFFLDHIWNGPIRDHTDNNWQDDALSFYYHGSVSGSGNPYFSPKVEDYSYLVYASRNTADRFAAEFGMVLPTKEIYFDFADVQNGLYTWDVYNTPMSPKGFYIPDKKEFLWSGILAPLRLTYIEALQGFEHAHFRLVLE